MKRMMIAAATIIMMGAPSLNAQDKITTNQFEEYVQVTGTAEKKIVPDEIYLKIIINENDTKGKVSVEKAEEQMIEKLKALGIDIDQDLSIGGMGNRMQKYWFRKNQASTNSTYELKVNSATMLGKVFQTLEPIGITDIEIAKVSHSKMKEIRNELRVEAMKDAQKIAKTLAEAVGQSIKEVVYIVDYNYDSDILPRSDVMVMGLSRAKASNEIYETELDFRQIKINHSVTAKFRLWYK